MTDFVFEGARCIRSEDGGAARLGGMVQALGGRRALLVTDRGLAATGLLAEPVASFAAAGVALTIFTDVFADPPESAIEQAVVAARRADSDCIVGLGGGSSLDTAKLVAALAGDDRPLSALYGFDRVGPSRLPLIQVPTTAGTGSEVTPIAIVTTPTDEKKAVVSARLLPDIALLDARLTLGLPPGTTAMTGIDAMVHAIEAYTSRLKKNPVSDALALKALALLSGSIGRAVTDGADLDARRDMLNGAMLAGLAFANAPVGAVHALAYPLGGRFHVPHGLSNALVLGPVLAFNLDAAERLYDDLGAVLPNAICDPQLTGGRRFVDAMTRLVQTMPIAQRLTDVGVCEADIVGLADDALNIQRLLVNNPRELTRGDVERIYSTVL